MPLLVLIDSLFLALLPHLSVHFNTLYHEKISVGNE
jgi:hypothetical protein